MLGLSVSTFLAVLLIMRFKEIARFTALTGHLSKTALFTAYQFPLILPIAIPISALIASLLLFQRLSRSFELMAFRACGLSFFHILAPLLFASAILCVANFSICSEIAPFCRRESKLMLYRETSSNPLLLLQRRQLVKLKRAYLKMSTEEEGVSAKNVFIIGHNERNNRLCLLHAHRLAMQEDRLAGSNVAIVSHLSGQEGAFDPLIVENQTSMSTPAPILSQFLKKNHPQLETTSLPLRALILQNNSAKAKAATKALVEILRRLSLSFAVFTFTLLGCAYGIEQGRSPGKRHLLVALLLTLTVLTSYLLGKEFKLLPRLASIALLAPHPFIWLMSVRRLKRLAQGCDR